MKRNRASGLFPIRRSIEDLVDALLVIKRNLIAAEEGRKAGTEGRK